MKRYYADYRTWEDYKAGMWNKEVRTDFIELSKDLLLNPLEAMQNVIISWPVSTKHNLSNLNSNRKSWLGQAACCLTHECSEFETRMAWKELTKEQQFYANQCANIVIEKWDKENKIEYVKEDFTL